MRLSYNSLMRRRWKLLVVVVLWAGLWLYFVWPTPWSYGVEYWETPWPPHERTARVRVRVNRLTGKKQNQGGPKGEWGYFVW